jgi:hypothetical protein
MSSIHRRTKKHLKTCWVCRLNKKASDRAHIVAHTLGALAWVALFCWIGVTVILGR